MTRPGSLVDETDYMRHFSRFDHDISENTGLIQAYADLTMLSSVNFIFDPELQETVRMVDSSLPQLKGFNVAELIRMIPEVVPPEIEFEYRYEPGGTVRLHLRDQESGN
jgi:hypothetical protein